MTRQHTPKELAEAERLLKEGQPLIDRVEREAQAEKERWAGEIAMLERRVREEFTFVNLGGDDKIAIRACLSNTEMTEIGRLDKRRSSLGKDVKIPDPKDPKAKPKVKRVLTEKDNDAANEITFEMLEIVTANPLLTREWFRENQEKYALGDMLTIILGFYESRVEEDRARMERIKSAGRFRTDIPGPELRGVPASPPDCGPEAVGGSPG